MSRSPLRAAAIAVAEVVTVGLPFCAFKILTGLSLRDTAGLSLLAWLLLGLGVADLLLNALNLLSLLVRRRRALGACVTDVIARKLGHTSERADLGLALDVLLSFVLVAVVIGFGLLRRMTPGELAVWNAAVILNVLGAGFGRLLSALRRPPSTTS